MKAFAFALEVNDHLDSSDLHNKSSTYSNPFFGK